MEPDAGSAVQMLGDAGNPEHQASIHYSLPKESSRPLVCDFPAGNSKKLGEVKKWGFQRLTVSSQFRVVLRNTNHENPPITHMDANAFLQRHLRRNPCDLHFRVSSLPRNLGRAADL